MIRRLNRAAILSILRQQSPISRTEIAKKLNMSLPTVMRIVDGLIEEDLVRSQGNCEATKGRPRPLLEFNGTSYVVVGVDLGGTKMYGTVADIAGHIQHEVYITQTNGDVCNNLDKLSGLIEELFQAPRLPGVEIRGIGIGAPGVTINPEGIVTFAPSLGWRDMPLKEIMTKRFGIPVFVENDVNLAALGEWGFGAGRGVHNLVCMAVGTGIGLGIIIGDTLYPGQHHAAGEIGYLLPGVEFLGRRYGQFGALEGLASGTGIAERARQVLKQEGRPFPSDGLSAEYVFAAARVGESWARRVVSETVDLLCLAITSISALLDPEIIILSGGVARSADLLIEPILTRIDGVVPFIPRIVASELGYRAAVMGAIMMVLQETMEDVIITRPV